MSHAQSRGWVDQVDRSCSGLRPRLGRSRLVSDSAVRMPARISAVALTVLGARGIVPRVPLVAFRAVCSGL